MPMVCSRRGERVIHREKQHWFVFVWEARYTILAVIAAIIVAILTSGMAGGDGTTIDHQGPSSTVGRDHPVRGRRWPTSAGRSCAT